MDIKFPPLTRWIFLKRLNRFTAQVRVEDQTSLAHVPNSNRMEELLVTGQTVWLGKASDQKRKTVWDLLLVEFQGGLVSFLLFCEQMLRLSVPMMSVIPPLARPFVSALRRE